MTIYSKATTMKIVVLQQKADKPDFYTIQVVDGSTIIHSENAQGLAERDEVVWKLADLYDALEIELKDKPKSQPVEFRFSEIPSIPILNESQAKAYFESNQQLVYDRMLQAIEEGIVTQRQFIRLFELSGTGVYITSIKSSWKAGLQQALEFYLENEQYENCAIAKGLIEKL
jgi:hypothetical protein